MSTINWKPGPAKTNDGREARIYAVEDYAIHGAIFEHPFWRVVEWQPTGRVTAECTTCSDLLPPKLSRGEVVKDCQKAWLRESSMSDDLTSRMRAALDHYDNLRREGLCDE